MPRHIYPLLVELDPNLARIIKLMVYFSFFFFFKAATNPQTYQSKGKRNTFLKKA